MQPSNSVESRFLDLMTTRVDILRPSRCHRDPLVLETPRHSTSKSNIRICSERGFRKLLDWVVFGTLHVSQHVFICNINFPMSFAVIWETTCGVLLGVTSQIQVIFELPSIFVDSYVQTMLLVILLFSCSCFVGKR